VNKAYKKIDIVASNPWFVVSGTVSSVAGFLWFLYDKWNENTGILSTVIFGLCLLIMLLGYTYSIKVRAENIALKGIAKTFGEINEIYRDTLKRLFSDNEPETDPYCLVREEEAVLQAICQRIGDIFSRLTNRSCAITIKLLFEENNIYYAKTLTRSEAKSSRDKGHRVLYEVGTGENLAFDIASRKENGHADAHFYSADLNKENHYTNQRINYINYYKSVLIVPIRGVNLGKEGTIKEFDNIGFLCVDTMSINRLNNKFHLYMLSSLSNQMYNFMSLMRGKYRIFVGEKNE